MKRFFLVIFSLAIILSAIENANACWCRKDPEETNTEENFRKTLKILTDNSDFVFSGKFIEVTDSQLIFEIGESWKGNLKGKVFFSQLHSANAKGERNYFYDSCQFYFEIGKSYLVYANTIIEGFSANRCGRTALLEKAERDIIELNKQKLSVSYFISDSFFRLLETVSSIKLELSAAQKIDVR